MAQQVNVKADLDEAMDFLSELGSNKEKMRKRILTGIGTSAKNEAKKAYRSQLKKRTGTLYKSLYSKVTRSGRQVIIAPSAENNKVRYGFVLAKGAVIKPKNGEFLTFKIGDKWIRKHQVTIREHDWVEGPVKRYLESPGYRERLDELMKKEVTRAEKAAQRNAT